MPERVSFIPETSADDSDDEQEEKSKKKKKASALVASVIEKDVPKPEQKTELKRSTFDKLFADLALEKEAKREEKDRAETTLAEAAGQKAEKSPEVAAEVPEIILSHELAPTQLNGGEVVIDLRQTPENIEVPLETPEADEPDTLEETVSESTDLVTAETAAPPDEEEQGDPYASPASAISSPPPRSGAAPHGSTSGASGGSGSSGSAASGGTTPPSGGRPPAPPIGPSPFPSPRRRNANTAAAPYANTMPIPPQANFNQLLAAQQAADEAWVRGRRRGHGEGLLAGLLVGGGIEHFRHKSRERKMEKKAKQESKKQEKALETAEFQHNQAAQTITAERLAHQKALQREADATISARQSEVAATARALAAEKARADEEKAKAELIERLNVQAAEQERLAAEERLRDPENRIETSAWHAIEVDKSGHAVQDTAIEYGHEYYRERAHEAGPKEYVDTKAGGAALTAITQTGADLSALPPIIQPPQPSGGAAFVDDEKAATSETARPKDAGSDIGTPSLSPLTTIIPLIVILGVIALIIAILL